MGLLIILLIFALSGGGGTRARALDVPRGRFGLFGFPGRFPPLQGGGGAGAPSLEGIDVGVIDETPAVVQGNGMVSAPATSQIFTLQGPQVPRPTLSIGGGPTPVFETFTPSEAPGATINGTVDGVEDGVDPAGGEPRMVGERFRI